MYIKSIHISNQLINVANSVEVKRFKPISNIRFLTD